MSLTKIGSIGINTGIQFAGVTTIATLNSSSNVLSVGGTVNFNSDVSIGGSVSIGGTLTYEDVTNIDSVGLVTARNGIVVGSGITLSKDGDIFATGVTTARKSATFGNTSDSFTALSITASTTGISELRLADTTVNAGYVKYEHSNDALILATGTTEKLRITSGGLLLLGTNTTTNNIRLGNKFGVVGTTAYTGMSITNYSGTNAQHSPMFDFNRSRGTSDGSLTSVVADDKLGELIFRGSDGSDFNDAVTIRAFVDGTPSDGTDMPGRLVFSTSADGSAAPTERLRITSTGRVGVNNTNPDSALSITGTGSDAATRISITDGSGVANVLGRYGNLSLQADEAGAVSGSLMQFKVDGSEVMRLDSGQNVNIGAYTSVAGLRYFDVQNSSSAANTHGSIIRLITSNAAGNSTTSLDMVKYKDGNFYISNFETGGNGNTNFYNGGQTRLTIRQDGIITKPYTPSFFATINGGDNTTNINNNIPFDQTKHNNGSHYDTTNYRFVAPVNGFYYFFVQIWAKNTTQNARFHFHFADASNSYAVDNITQNGMHSNGLNLNDHCITASIVWAMDANDFMSVRPDNTNLTYYTAGASDPHSYFCGYLIG